MKITDDELRMMVREAIEKKIAGLKEGKDFSARRQIVHSAEKVSMDFEKEIVGLLGLVKPDEMPPALQKQYFLVVEEMKSKIKSAVMEATRKLAKLPKANTIQNRRNKH